MKLTAKLQRRLLHIQQCLTKEQADQALNKLDLLPAEDKALDEVQRFYGLAWLLSERPDRAIGYLEPLYQRYVGQNRVGLPLAQCLYKLDRDQEALALLGQLNPPEDKSDYQNLGSLYFSLGHPDKAKYYLEAVLERDPNNIKALNMYSYYLRFTPDHPFTKRLQRLTQPDVFPEDIEQQIPLFLALGQMHQDLGDKEASFQAFHRANQLVFPTRKPSDDVAPYFVKALELLTPENTVRLRQAQGHPARQEVFVCGQSRSGKSLAETLLACHPEVDPSGEHKLFRKLLSKKADLTKKAKRYLLDSTPETFYRDAVEYLEQRQLPADRLTTNTLPQNLTVLHGLGLWLPQVPVIFVTRDVKDLGLAQYFKHYAQGYACAYDLKSCGRNIRFHEALIDFWIQVLPNPCLKICYEDMVQRPAALSKKLYEFLGLDWQPDYFKILQDQRDFSEHISAHQSTDTLAAIRDDFVGWSADYDHHLGPLMEGYEEASLEVEKLLQGAQKPEGLQVKANFKKASSVNVSSQSLSELQAAFKQALAQHAVHKARQLADQLVRKKPKEPRLLRLRAIAASLSGDSTRALKDFNQALIANPKDFGLQVNLLRAELRAGQPDAASKRLKKLTASFAGEALLPRLELEVFLAQPSRNQIKLEAQLNNCQQLLAIEPNDPELISAQACLHSLLGDSEKALPLHQKALDCVEQLQQEQPESCQQPLMARLLVVQAKTLIQAQKYPQALSSLQQACELRPHSLATVEAWQTLQQPNLCSLLGAEQQAQLQSLMEPIQALYIDSTNPYAMTKH